MHTKTVAGDPPRRKRGLGQRLIWIGGMTSVLLFGFYLSLLMTSNDLGFERREVVQRAIVVLEEKGFTKEAFVIKRLATYRSTDNWWNEYVGHRDAYAATNFPFEVLTLYPEFFEVSVDDEERAAILLHEAYHLLGYGEEAALEAVWRNKQALGWTVPKYAESKVWKNTRELTMSQVPQLFRCGNDGKSDCLE
jgi:GNAT superfamily N-acetyltransferase